MTISRPRVGGSAAPVVNGPEPSPRRLRVALNAIMDLTPKYGARVYLLELARELAKLDDIDLVLLVGKGATKHLPSELIRRAREVAVPYSRSYWQFFYQLAIRKALKEERVDVYHLPNRIPFFFVPCPSVVTIHDLAELRTRKYGVFRTLYGLAVNYWTSHACDRLITVSHASKHDLTSLLRVPAAKVSVIYNGVDCKFRPLNRLECGSVVSSRYGLQGEFVLAPGGLSLNKNVERLLSAFAQLTEQIPHRLVITGWAEAERVARLHRQVKALGLGERVTLTGFVPAADLPLLYNASSLVVYPSLYEGFGLPIVEATACGVPVIASNFSCLPEVAGDAAFFVDPYDPDDIARAIARVLSDHDLRQRLTSRGFEQAGRFSWRKAAREAANVYLAVAGRVAVPEASDIAIEAGVKQG